MKIKVTQEDIDKGEKNDCRNCPVALAISREFPGAVVRAHFSFIYIENEIVRVKRVASNHVKLFMNNFDLSINVSPIEFELTEKAVSSLEVGSLKQL